MSDLPLTLAIAAGTVAALNPCGFALLPVYLSLFVLGDDKPSKRVAVVRALIATAAMTAGFVLVFVTFGLVLAPVAGAIQPVLPYFTLGFGLALVALGLWLLAGRGIPGLTIAARSGKPLRRSWPSMAGFGVAYALASLSCTIGPFLAIVISSFRAGSVFGGISLFLAYAAGMALVVGTAALAMALAHTSVVGKLRRLAPVMSKVGGAIVVLAGAYVAYYGWYEITILRGGDTSDSVINAASSAQRWLTTLVADIRWPLAAVAAVALIAALATKLYGRRNRAGRVAS